MLVSETADRVGCGKNEAHVETHSKMASEGFSEESSRSPARLAICPTRGNTQEGTTQWDATLPLPAPWWLAMKEETPQPSLHGVKGQRLNSGLQVWPCLLMQGKERPPTWGQKAASVPAELRTSGRWASPLHSVQWKLRARQGSSQ